MPRNWRVWCLLLVVVGGVAGVVVYRRVGGSTDGEARALVWAGDAEGGAPYIFKDSEHPEKNLGFEVDLAEALSRELGRPIEFKQYDFKSLVPGLERGDFDFAMNGLEITPDRQKKLIFTRPYYVYKLQLVVRADDSRFKTLTDLDGRDDVTVGTLEDTAAERLLQSRKIKYKNYDGQVEPYQDLGLGRIDAVLLDLPIAVYYAKPDKKLRFAGEPLEPGYYAIAFSPRKEARAKEIDSALGRLFE
jgi:polar amino acid transport system substrate-binding protein